MSSDTSPHVRTTASLHQSSPHMSRASTKRRAWRNPARVNHLPMDESAILAAYIIRRCRRLGRESVSLPILVKRALSDLCSEGDPTASLLSHWLRGTAPVGMPYTPAEVRREMRCPSETSPTRMGERIWRHGRPWRPGNPILLRRDEQRRLKLLSLLLEEIAHEYH